MSYIPMREDYEATCDSIARNIIAEMGDYGRELIDDIYARYDDPEEQLSWMTFYEADMR